MNEQEALKTLTEMQNEGVDLFDEAFPLSYRRQMAESLIFAISAIERSQWVAVEIGEKPDAVDFQTEHLVSVDGKNGNKFVSLATYEEGRGWRDIDETNGYGEPIYIETDYGPVTAYREVPEPYTPKEQI